MQPNYCNDGSTSQHTTPVSHYPQGQSPFGVLDLCGNTWEWTESESSDGRTRFCLLKGGSFYQAHGSNWYFEGGPQKNQHSAKFLLLHPGLDRCSTISFRCVTDLQPR
jgi:formylglycine-generating enzyme required for sulfatase activity